MRGLAEEGRHLSFPRVQVSRGAEGRERAGGGQEGVVGVEPAGQARRVVAMEEEPIEEVPGNDGCNPTAAAAAAIALALATATAVVGGAAAEPELAAAEAVGALGAAGLRAALLGRSQLHRGRRQDDGQDGRRTRCSQRGHGCWLRDERIETPSQLFYRTEQFTRAIVFAKIGRAHV